MLYTTSSFPHSHLPFSNLLCTWEDQPLTITSPRLPCSLVSNWGHWRHWQKMEGIGEDKSKNNYPFVHNPSLLRHGKEGKEKRENQRGASTQMRKWTETLTSRGACLQGWSTWTMNLSLMTLKDWRLGRGTESNYNWDWILWSRGKKIPDLGKSKI